MFQRKGKQMSNLISRKALIERLNEQIDGVLANRDVYTDADDVVDSILSIIDIIENQPPAQQWIPVEERLPEEDGEYLCQIDVHGRAVMEVIGFSNNLYKVDEYDFFDCKGKKGFYGYDSEMGYYETSGVIAWMPLPEPMKTKE